MRLLAPLAILAGALAALVATPPGAMILGFTHHEFAAAAMGLALLVAMLGWIRRGDVARVVGSIVIWAAATAGLMAAYAYRYEAADVINRVAGEFMPAEPQVGQGGSVIVNRRLGGDFAIAARINGARVTLIFDTGASVVVLTEQDAKRIGIKTATLSYDVPVSTANGTALAASARLDEIAVGTITEHDVRALVVKPDALEQSLLGMSFLERLKSYAVERNRLVLTQR
jgi:aspartyl protease family protein